MLHPRETVIDHTKGGQGGGTSVVRVELGPGLVGSILVWTTVAALHAVVPGFGILFALRIALGVAEGPSFPGAAQTMQRILPAAERERGFGVLFTGSSIGGMIAPPLASFLFGIAGWRLAFVGTALVGLVWIPLWIAITSRRRIGSFTTRGANSSTHTTPAYCRKIAFAAVVHFVATTNAVRHAP